MIKTKTHKLQYDSITKAHLERARRSGDPIRCRTYALAIQWLTIALAHGYRAHVEWNGCGYVLRVDGIA